MLAIAACGLVSCKKTEQDQTRRYSLKGKVVSVDTKNGYVEVDHEAIPGFMAAMTMPYPVPDTRALSNLAAGDEITATVVVTDHGAHLEDVAVTKKGAAAEEPPKK
jgi:protein SCO1/2